MPQIAFKDGLIQFDAAAPSVPGAEAGATVLFVHGVGADHEIWRDWRTVLAPHFATVALDLPGRGGSFRPGAAFDWSFDDLAGMIHAVARAAQAGQLILIGESLGGTACLAAASEPQVAAVITCSTTHIGPTLRHVEEWRAMMDSDGIEGWSADMLAKRFAPGQCDQDKRDWFDKTQRASDGEAILALADLLVGLDLSDRLARITCPVLVIQPDASPFIPLDVPVALKQGLPDADLMVLPGTRHGIACSHGEICATAVLDFLVRRQLA